MTNEELTHRAAEVRSYVVKMLAAAGAGHPGGSLSIVEILQVLYGEFMHVDPQKPHWPDRDRLILSRAMPHRPSTPRLCCRAFSRKQSFGNCASAVLCSRAYRI